jgi:lysophospholipase L1-like esterase
MIRAGWVGAHADLTRTIDPASPSYYAELFRTQKRNGTYPDGIFKTVSAAEMLAANPPVFFERNITNLAALAKRHGVGVVIATFAYSSGFPDEPRVTSEEYIGALAEHNAVLRRVARTEDAALFDFAKVFPRDARYFSDGRHVNVEGSRLKARLFADFLVESDLLSAGR